MQGPGQAQPHQDVKHITAYGVRDGHVSQTLPRHNDTGHTVWDTGASSQEGNAHDNVRDAQCKSNYSHHPHHDVGEGSNPDGGGKEGDHEPALPAPFGTVWHREKQQQRQRPHEQPLHLITTAGWHFKWHHWPVAVLLSVSLILIVVVVVSLVLGFVAGLEPLQPAPPVQTLLYSADAVLQTPPGLGPGGGLRVSVCEAGHPGLSGVDQSLSLIDKHA